MLDRLRVKIDKALARLKRRRRTAPVVEEFGGAAPGVE
jgi:hypothetical protein